MTEVLYANFLEDKRVYNLARASWKRFFDKLAKDNGLSYIPYINQLQGGKLEYDGNPIFSAYVPKLNRAVRIIQVEAEDDELEISAWVDSIELQEGKPAVEELVLDMVLSLTAKKIAVKLVVGWLVSLLPKGEVLLKLEAEKRASKSRIPKKVVSEPKEYKLGDWDLFILKTLQESSRLVIFSELMKKGIEKAEIEKLTLNKSDLKGKLNRSIHKLSEKHRKLVKINRGKELGLGLAEWTNKKGKIKKKFTHS